ncbi:hypothetical protein SipoB123_37845 [Streptomyces ipomoeae]|nr:hypothetical protein SipoB123_37845 [Streptomyces ipomoeae]
MRPMRRTAHVLSAPALIGAVLGAAAPAAYADPAAQVDPQTVAPGGTVTISVSCDPTDGPAPETIDAGSQAFEQGTVTLQRLPGNDDPADGPSYQGTATIAPAADFEIGVDATGGSTEWGVDGSCPAPPGGEEKQWSATLTVHLGDDPNQPAHGDPYQPTQPDQQLDPLLDPQSGHQGDPLLDPQSGHQGDPLLDPQSGHQGDPLLDPQPDHQGDHHATHWPTHHPDHQSTHTPAPVQRGVHAGDGGAFSDSVPAMVAGGLLIVGALVAVVHRLRNRDRWMP